MTTATENDTDTRGKRFRRWSAWLSVFAVVVQVLLPLSQLRAAAPWERDGLFPPVCSVHAVDQSGTDTPNDGEAVQHCPLCQLHAADRFLPPVRMVVPAFQPVIVEIVPGNPDAAQAPPARASPPTPPRGPPYVA